MNWTERRTWYQSEPKAEDVRCNKKSSRSRSSSALTPKRQKRKRMGFYATSPEPLNISCGAKEDPETILCHRVFARHFNIFFLNNKREHYCLWIMNVTAWFFLWCSSCHGRKHNSVNRGTKLNNYFSLISIILRILFATAYIGFINCRHYWEMAEKDRVAKKLRSNI